MSATATAWRFEYADWWDAVIKEPLLPESGMIRPNEASMGAGIEWNEEAIAAYLVE